MISGEDIYLTVVRAKYAVGCWANQLVEREDNGDKIECDEYTFMMLVWWIGIMENYYDQNYDTNNSIIAEPDYECLSASEAAELLAKIKTIIGVC